jgi:hypothetical protein
VSVLSQDPCPAFAVICYIGVMQDYEIFACMEKKTLIEATYRINVIRFKRIMKKEGISIQKSPI